MANKTGLAQRSPRFQAGDPHGFVPQANLKRGFKHQNHTMVDLLIHYSVNLILNLAKPTVKAVFLMFVKCENKYGYGYGYVYVYVYLHG